MPAAYSIWIVSPPGYPHSRCFEDLALGLREGFRELGREVPIVTDPAQITGRAIVLGANLLADFGLAAPAGAIVFNLEQIAAPESPWLTPGYFDVLRSHRVWDYSRRNVEALAGLGVTAQLCEIGYVAALTRIAPLAAEQQDIDVLFVGSVNERRGRVIEDLRRRGVRAAALFGVYGAQRDTAYARARIALNLHYYEARVFEMVRVSYLLANRICVVSETGADPEAEAALAGGVAFSPYERLAETCIRLLAAPDERRAVADRGFERFAARPQAPRLAAALAAVEASPGLEAAEG